MQPAAPKETDGATYAVTAYPLYTPNWLLARAAKKSNPIAPPATAPVTSSCSRLFRPKPGAAEVNKMVKVIGQPIPDDVRPVDHQVFADALRSQNPQALVHLRLLDRHSESVPVFS